MTKKEKIKAFDRSLPKYTLPTNEVREARKRYAEARKRMPYLQVRIESQRDHRLIKVF